MTKLLKGQAARFTSDVSEFMSGRQLASMQGRITVSSASDAAAAFSSTDAGSMTLERPLRVKGFHPEFGLPCPTGKELLANFVARGGGRVGDDNSPIMFDGDNCR